MYFSKDQFIMGKKSSWKYLLIVTKHKKNPKNAYYVKYIGFSKKWHLNLWHLLLQPPLNNAKLLIVSADKTSGEVLTEI